MSAQPESRLRAAVHTAQYVVLAALTTAMLWDAAALLLATPFWWPTVSYTVFAAALGTGCIVLLARLMLRRSAEPRPHGSGTHLVAIGLLLLGWLLRGHPEIPADPPIVAASLVAALLYAVPLARRGG